MLECSECDKAFITQLNLKMHMKTLIELSNEQSGQKKKYDQCPFETHKTYNLNKHKKLHDKEPLEIPEEQIYKCNICPYENKNKFTLKKHKLSLLSLSQCQNTNTLVKIEYFC